MLIEDEKEMYLMERAFLTLIPQSRLLKMYNGLQALDHLMEKRILSEGVHRVPDLIICDMEMPYVNGLEFLLKIKEMPDFKNIPVYILTNEQNPVVKQRMKEAGAEAYFIKPLTQHDLSLLLSKILDMYHKRRP
jgi:CheY-like chemotaxis protein